MNRVFVTYLFNHHYFVNQPEQITEAQAETRLSLAKLFNIRITYGAELLQPVMIRTASEIIGDNVPRPFYLGFPESVRKLTIPELLIDQLLHYYNTYGQDNFDEAGHSVIEDEIERKVFDEKTPVKDFAVLTEAEAIEKIKDYTQDLLSGTRPLSEAQYKLVLTFIREYHYTPASIASKNTAMRLLIDSRDTKLADFLMLSDVPKLADELNYRSTGNKDPNKLNLKNQDRKLLTAILNKLIAEGKIDTRTCYEKKARWSGLLHHIHYKTSDPKGRDFLNAMRGDENHSVMSEFEQTLAEKGTVEAAEILLRRKGSGALLRNLDYLLSRCESDKEIRNVIGMIDTSNNIILLQLLLHYYSEPNPLRTFRFIKYNKMRKHTETPEESKSRKTNLANRDRKAASSAIQEILEKNLKGKLGKVYIDPLMKNIALPLQEGASQGGFGTLTKGSRVPLPEGKKLRAFTYWEKVNDIDLSVFGLDKNQKQTEFSWRNMAYNQSEAITFSGDQTSGFDGGSEYFDIDLKEFKKQKPDIRYLIFCNNIYTNDVTFDKCVCRAGYMFRDFEESGEVFEPKTVKSSYTINCTSRFAYLFGLDLTTNDFVWLNVGNENGSRIAATDNMSFLTQYFEMTKIFNVYDFFTLMAGEVVDVPKDAEIAVTDEEIETGEATEIIRSYDIEKIIAYLNKG
ncbi:MAG: TerD family protein [Anaerolineaceae bacterium]|nr:TerD family protein [Anaerolineaceae bacterium]